MRVPTLKHLAAEAGCVGYDVADDAELLARQSKENLLNQSNDAAAADGDGGCCDDGDGGDEDAVADGGHELGDDDEVVVVAVFVSNDNDAELLVLGQLFDEIAGPLEAEELLSYNDENSETEALCTFVVVAVRVHLCSRLDRMVSYRRHDKRFASKLVVVVHQVLFELHKCDFESVVVLQLVAVVVVVLAVVAAAGPLVDGGVVVVVDAAVDGVGVELDKRVHDKYIDFDNCWQFDSCHSSHAALVDQSVVVVRL